MSVYIKKMDFVITPNSMASTNVGGMKRKSQIQKQDGCIHCFYDRVLVQETKHLHHYIVTWSRIREFILYMDMSIRFTTVLLVA